MLNGFLWVNGVWVYQIWVLLLWVLGVWYLIRVDSNFVELGLGLCYWFLPGLFLEEKKGLVFKEHFLLVSWLPNVTWRRCHFFILFYFFLYGFSFWFSRIFLAIKHNMEEMWLFYGFSFWFSQIFSTASTKVAK